LKDGCDAQVKGTAFSNVMQGVEKGETFYSFIIISQSFGELVPWTVNFTSVFQFFPLPYVAQNS
jgi:hypothetical protein